jgi:uncharacterized membrane protein
MIRNYFSTMQKPKTAKKENIVWRSHEVTRIEAFSDAVFAFAVSLLVISLEVPKNSKEVLESLRGLIPFAFCFLIIFWIWRSQYKFFRRYGLHDWTTLTINGVLLFLTLAFVYPLKFLFSSLLVPQIYTFRPQDFAPMIMLYNGGFAVIELIFTLMYVNAYRRRSSVNLAPVEVFETVSLIIGFTIPTIVSALAVLIAYVERNNGPDKIDYCFMAYALLGIFMPLLGNRRDKLFKKKFGNVPLKEPERNPEE